MGGLRQTSSVNSNLGALTIISGKITVASGTWTLDDDNDAVTLTDESATRAGRVSLSFNYPFIAAPAVTTAILDLSNESDVVKSVMIDSLSTTGVSFQCHSIDDTGVNTTDITTADPDDNDGWTFTIVGMANP